MNADQSSPPRRRRSSSGGRSRPRLVSGGAKVPEGGSADQVGLEVEDVVDCGMGGEELLGRGSGLELLLLSLPPPDRQMGVFGAVVLPHPSWLVAIGQAQIPSCGAIRSQFVGDNGLGADALVPQQFPKQPKGRALVAALLDRHVQDLAFVVHGPPGIHPLAGDLQHHLVEMPSTGGPR